MRIISKFNDYYDSVQGYGIDTSLNYIRKTEEYSLYDAYNVDDYSYRGYVWNDFDGFLDTLRSDELIFTQIIVGFCGSVYSGIYIRGSDYLPSREHVNNYTHEFAYTIDDVYKYYKRNNINFKKSDISKKFHRWSNTIKLEGIKHWLNTDLNKPNYTRIFIDYRVPIYMIHRPHLNHEVMLRLNPNLSKIDFQRVKDPFTAYQEISQYISGVLGVNSPDMVSISDKSMRDKKGFDDWSFKKRPTKRKK